MKNLAFFLTVVFIFSACSSSKELSSVKTENKKTKKLAEKAEIRKAVESRKYIIKVNRIYPLGGGRMDLVPRSNFIIINGEIASISLGYVGRTYSSRPISGINLNGHTFNYQMESDDAKGMFKIQMEVQSGGDKFNVYLTIGDEGYCSISINNPYLEAVSYSGNLVPLLAQKEVSTEKEIIN
jgi:hypothetical protein